MLDAALIERSARLILAACPADSCIIVFGSQARGDTHPHSDVDLMVIQPQVHSRIAEAARLARILRPLRVPADIVVISRDDFENWKDAPNNVFYHAHREGRRIA